MENDQRLTPLPTLGGREIQSTSIDYSSGYTGSYDDSLAGKRSIRQYINVVYKRLPMIIALTIVVTAVVALYQYQQPSIYAASTSIIIEPRKPEVTKKDAININFGDDQKYYDTQLELLKSPDLMRSVVIALGLHRDANALSSRNTGLWAGLKSLFGGGQKKKEDADVLPVVDDAPAAAGDEPQLSPEEETRAQTYAAELAGSITVTPKERTNIVIITVTSPNPAIAAKVADKTAELFKKQDEERETKGARDAYADLGKSIEDLKATIDKEQNDFIDLMTSSNLPLQEKGGDVRASDLTSLITSWRQAQNEASKLEAQYNAAVAASRSGNVATVIPDDKAINDARTENNKRREDLQHRLDEIDKKIEERQQKKQELLAKYTEQFTSVKQVQAEIDTLIQQRARIEKEVTSRVETEGGKRVKDAERQALATLEAQYSAAKAREARAYSLVEAASSKSAVEGQAETRLTGLKDELKNNRDLLNTYTQRQKEQELALATDKQENIKIQSKASPGALVGPPRNRNILVAFLLSLAAGIGLAFLLDYLDDSVRTSDDVSRHLGLPTLALIPHYLNTERRKLLSAGDNGPPAAPSALITLEETHSPMAEAYRHLRTSLLFSSAGKPPQTILVTSSQPSEGKTTTAVNTAITLAQADADVVIVDCDLRRPRLHSHFGLENTQGLTNYLSGDKNTENLIRPYAELPRLKIITSGPIPPNPAELLSSNEMRNLLTFLSGKFKHVIIDSPPAISFADASILATLVDGVVLVAMANKSSIHLMRQFKTRIHNIGARIYGVVLNGIKSGSVEYDYYGSGYYKYYAEADDDTSTPRMEKNRDVLDEE
ncbi:MAG: polysaccharide biosynthesis tyrosine autokinase [Acidobacteria bacterium]|nr:polysaccharide biosynthesis tyrosine autokinase [Acidobacteriota bacterium]